jgi:hypothetical protein
VFTARYALSPYIKQVRFVFKGLKDCLMTLRYEVSPAVGGPVNIRIIRDVTPCSVAVDMYKFPAFWKWRLGSRFLRNFGTRVPNYMV